ncbi:MAG TPA: hypothetical protein VL651_12280 [Bacteroidia bacterium]|nr:hypothetical protein [Bacteroidia bacterium]
MVLFFWGHLFAQHDTIVDGFKLHLQDIGNSDSVSRTYISDTVTHSGKFLQLYPGGKVKSYGSMNKGSKVGAWDEYYSSGQLRSHGLYTRHGKEGIWREYYPDGKIFSKGNYTNGEKDGLWKTWYENDSLMSRGQYWHDNCTGTWNWWYDNGKLKAHAKYLARTHLEKRKVPFGHDVTDPKGHYITWKKRYTFFNVDSLVEYYPNGNLRSKIMYDAGGNRNGQSEFWYENGNVNRIEYYKGGKGIGCWKVYCEDGELFSLGENNTEQICEDPEHVNPDCGYPGDIIPLIPNEIHTYPIAKVGL